MIYAPARRANAPRYWRTYATFLYQRLIPCLGRTDRCSGTGHYRTGPRKKTSNLRVSTTDPAATPIIMGEPFLGVCG